MQSMNQTVKPSTVVFDLDGTLADVEHRRHHLQGKRPNWAAFNDECHLDTINEPIVQLLRAMQLAGFKIIICSGREATPAVAEKTVRWLADHHIHYDGLYMRDMGDYRRDCEVKADFIEQIGAGNILFSVDDRNQVVEEWRAQGITCLQCAEGDF